MKPLKPRDRKSIHLNELVSSYSSYSEIFRLDYSETLCHLLQKPFRFLRGSYFCAFQRCEEWAILSQLSFGNALVLQISSSLHLLLLLGGD